MLCCDFDHFISYLFSQIVVGDSGLTLDQAKAQFAVWSIFAAVSNLVIAHYLAYNYFMPYLFLSSLC